MEFRCYHDGTEHTWRPWTCPRVEIIPEMTPDKYLNRAAGLQEDPSLTQPVPVVDLCERCGRPWEIGMWPTCKGNPEDHGARLKSSPFPSFEVEGVGTIDSITKLREVERSSMEAYRRGEGQPLVFRAFTQDKSNQDSNVFGRPDQGARKRSNIRIRQVKG